MIISTDFDGTLCEHKYPDIGEPYLDIINWLIGYKKSGAKLILLTCRDKKELQEAVEWCKGYGLEFDAVNDDVPEVKATFTNKSNKVYADIYLDDRNITLDMARKSMERWK
jgi:hypothetical protein